MFVPVLNGCLPQPGASTFPFHAMHRAGRSHSSTVFLICLCGNILFPAYAHLAQVLLPTVLTVRDSAVFALTGSAASSRGRPQRLCSCRRRSRGCDHQGCYRERKQLRFLYQRAAWDVRGGRPMGGIQELRLRGGHPGYRDSRSLDDHGNP